VIETALSEEMTGHLGYEKNDLAGQGQGSGGNVRNGSRPKTVSSGPVEIDVPRDRAGTFEPQIVRKRQRRLSGVDEVVLSLYAKGLTTGEISAHFMEIYGASVSRETVSRITDKVIEEMQAWQNRPLDEIYAAVFTGAIVVKIRDGQVANRPACAAIGVTLDGRKDVLGLWAGTGGEGAKFWMSVLLDMKNRGVRDVFFLVCDGLKGLPAVVANVWPQARLAGCWPALTGTARSGCGTPPPASPPGLPCPPAPRQRRERHRVQPGWQAAGQRPQRRHGPAMEPPYRPGPRVSPDRRPRGSCERGGFQRWLMFSGPNRAASTVITVA
jgi:Transposase, Mutator family